MDAQMSSTDLDSEVETLRSLVRLVTHPNGVVVGTDPGGQLWWDVRYSSPNVTPDQASAIRRCDIGPNGWGSGR